MANGYVIIGKCCLRYTVNKYITHSNSIQNDRCQKLQSLSWYVNFSLFQAFVGVAFSVGFVFGPIIGAVFSRFARDQQEQFYTTPALFALALAVIDIGFILMFFKETLPEHKRVWNHLSPSSFKEHYLHLILIYCVFSISNLIHAR